jgi:putative glutathione S-transferase
VRSERSSYHPLPDTTTLLSSDVSVVHPHMDDLGWRFNGTSNETFPAATSDKVYGLERIRDLYFKADPGYKARFTVPVIWDKKQETIVSNESSEIIRFLNDAFDGELSKEKADLDFYPQDLRKEIDELNDWVYSDINNGVYKSGFATTQEAYENAVKPLGDAMQRVEKILSDGRDFLVGGKLTEADIR